MNDYQKKCKKLADIYLEASVTGQPIQRINCKTDGHKNVIDGPTQISDLALYRIKPKEHPMQKYIRFGLDMEFIYDAGLIVIGLLKTIDKYNYYNSVARDTPSPKCRLRPNHVHWWNGESNINPIPEGCEFRIYFKSCGWDDWIDYKASNDFVWNKGTTNDVLAFEIRYDGEN